jgi:hypothetical protein
VKNAVIPAQEGIQRLYSKGISVLPLLRKEIYFLSGFPLSRE